MFANSKKDWDSLPAGAKAVRSKGGNVIPMVFVTSADGSKGIDAISYDVLKTDMRDAVRDLRKSLETIDVLAGGADKPTPSSSTPEPETKSESEMAAEAQEWVNAEGKTIVAAVKKVEYGQIVFVMPDGREVSYPIANLSAESQEKARELEE